ncbi:MAG: hypothetical protein ACK58L_04620, partial [Planctomycetota bacterium]
MGTRLFLLFLILFPTDEAAKAFGSGGGISDEAQENVPSRPVEIKTVPLSEVRDRVSSGEYVPVPRARLNELIQVLSDPLEPGIEIDRPAIQDAKYSAVFKGTRLESGTVQFQLYKDALQDLGKPLILGATNLHNLRIEDSQGQVPLGADFSQRLFLLNSVTSSALTGSFSADGQVAGDVVTFVLSLPESTTSSLTLQTHPQIQVTSVGSLVIGPVHSGRDQA